jgi:hypothetical protein
MRVKISIRYGRTFKIKDYESERIDIELEQDLNLEQFLKWHETADKLLEEIEAKVRGFHEKLGVVVE